MSARASVIARERRLPFDLPPDNLDQLRAEPCRSAEVRKSYLSKPAEDDHEHEHFHVEERPSVTPPPPPFPPGRQMLAWPHWAEEQRRQATFAAVVAAGLSRRRTLLLGE
jgi:hypothetical protein